MSRPLYECPVCLRVSPWTDGTLAAEGAERDEFWCQTCGTETPLGELRRADQSEEAPPGAASVLPRGEG